MDVDVVIDLQILAETDAYRTLEENLQRLGFERAENGKTPMTWSTASNMRQRGWRRSPSPSERRETESTGR